MYMVTGGAGFIGSQIVHALNEQGHDDILVVDDLTDSDKVVNLNDCRIADYMDIDELRDGIETGLFDAPIHAICHQGACSDTMESDGQYMMDNNHTFSKMLLHLALEEEIPFVYASSAATYGANATTTVAPENEKPLNVYGYSKLVFDQYVRTILPTAKSTVVGLRYFNVYGIRETCKGPMASMVYQLHRQLRETGVAKLFEGTDGYDHGEQRRDFVFVGDVVKVNRFLLDGPVRHGIVNVGTSQSRSFNDIANTLIKLKGDGQIEYVPFPDSLQGKYQSFTEADLTPLRDLGYAEPFASLEDGIAQCADAWNA